MPVGNWARGAQLRIVGELHGQQTINVLHLGTDEVANDAGTLNEVLLQLATAMRDCVVEFLLPAVTQDWRFVRTDAKEIFPTATDPIVVSGTPGQVGELGVTSVSFAASLATLRSGQGGRRGRGRVFLPPAGEAQTAASLIDEPTLVLLAAFTACVATKFMGANPESNWHLGVLSAKDLNKVPANFNTAFRVVSSINLSAEVAVMRSRRRGHGN
jgi:hypothetical protein